MSDGEGARGSQEVEAVVRGGQQPGSGRPWSVGFAPSPESRTAGGLWGQQGAALPSSEGQL